MSNVRLTVGGDLKDDVSRRAIDAWHRAERGETFHERHLAFENWNTLARVLTVKRMELLSYVRRNNVASVRALANALGRDYSNVHADVKALAGAGLLDATSRGVRADYDTIETKIAI
jgi:predicted transcriptional regulator